MARFADALVHVNVARDPYEPRLALTLEPVVRIRAPASVPARIGRAVVDTPLARDALITAPALARVPVLHIHARPVIRARCRSALVGFEGAHRPREPGRASALIAEGSVDAHGPRVASVADAGVYLAVASGALVTSHAVALEAVDALHAARVSRARVRLAFVDVDLTPTADVARVTGATVRTASTSARGVVVARARLAVVDAFAFLVREYITCWR